MRYLLIISTLTAVLTAFFYLHESLPKPLRAITSLLETPVAVASGISYYFGMGIPVYESVVAIILANLIGAVVMVGLVKWIIKKMGK